MHHDTPTGYAVTTLNLVASYDAAVKSLLAHKPFLARIMKDCLPEYRDCTVEEIMTRYIEGDPCVASVGVHTDETHPRIRGGNTEDAAATEGTVFYDIRFNALAPKGDDTIGIIINVEAQNRSNPGYALLKRAIYYCSRMISAQKNVEFTGSDYDSLKKVYSIWICSNGPKAEQSTITAYAMREIPLVGNVAKPVEEYDLLSVVMIRLGEVPQHEDGSVDEHALNRNVLGMLEVLFKGELSADQRKTILERHYGIEMTTQIEEEVGQMCNLSQGVMEKGMQKGFLQGIEQGIEQGLEKGRTEGIDIGAMKKAVEMAKKMLAKNRPMEEIVEFTELSLEEVQRLQQELLNSN